MEQFENIQILRAKFAAALAHPIPGKRPILKLIRPHFKRPPFNRTHKILRRRHRKKDKNPEHYNIPVKPYFALRWVKNDHPVEPAPDVIVHMEQFEDLPRRVMPDPLEEAEEMDDRMVDPDDLAQEQFYGPPIPAHLIIPPVANGPPPPPPPVLAQEQFYDQPPPPVVFPEEAAIQNPGHELAQEQFYDQPPPPVVLPDEATIQNPGHDLAQEQFYDQPPPSPLDLFQPLAQDDDDGPAEVVDQALAPPSPRPEPPGHAGPPLPGVVRHRYPPKHEAFDENNNWSDSKLAPPLKKNLFKKDKDSKKYYLNQKRYHWF